MLVGVGVVPSLPATTLMLFTECNALKSGVPSTLSTAASPLRLEIVHDALKEGGFDLRTVTSSQEAVAMIESRGQVFGTRNRRQSQGPMKGWEIARLVGEIDPAFSDRLHDGRCGRRLGVGRRAQQHPSEKAVRASAACNCFSAIAQCRRSQCLGVASQIGALGANAQRTFESEPVLTRLKWDVCITPESKYRSAALPIAMPSSVRWSSHNDRS